MRTCELDDCGRPHRARGLCAMHYRHQQGRGDRYEELPCAFCGTVTLKKVRSDVTLRYCSIACRSDHFSAQAARVRAHCEAEKAKRSQLVHVPDGPRSCEVPAWHQSRRRDGLTSGGAVVWVSGDCVRCGKATTVRMAQSVGLPVAVTCSASCQKAESKSRRRARVRNAYVEPVFRKRIFERDGWVCQLCGDPVVPDAKVPHHLAPTIDHIVPLAPYRDREGGPHSMANAQTAHFLCNSRKTNLI
jgi:hypothetical protein